MERLMSYVISHTPNSDRAAFVGSIHRPVNPSSILVFPLPGTALGCNKHSGCIEWDCHTVAKRAEVVLVSFQWWFKYSIFPAFQFAKDFVNSMDHIRCRILLPLSLECSQIWGSG
jgi:hypothetical protein